MITCYIDGSCRINPHGEMGYAYIIKKSAEEVIKFSDNEPKRHGNTSNVAEYKALEALLLKLIELDFTKEEVLIKTDSTLIYRQFMLKCKPKTGFYVELAYDMGRLFKRFHNTKFKLISREENQEADSLATKYY